MAEEKMKNPYDEEIEEESFTLSRRAMWRMVVLFVLVCLNPPLFRNVYEATKGADGWVPVREFFRKPADESLVKHLKSYETKLEDADFTNPPRRLLQDAITGIFRAGNRKTMIGNDGWLYFQPALDGLTGYGPLTPEPDSVAKDPNREPWNGPSDVIRRFAGQLETFGVELLLVPLPVKPMIYPEHLSRQATEGPVRHPDAARFYAGLSELPNVTLLDLADDFWKLKATEQVFLKQDTHWTPEAMEYAAKRIASELRQRGWFADAGSDPARYELLAPEERAAIGDLVEKLDVLPQIDGYVPQAGFDLEKVSVQRVIDSTTGLAPRPSVESPVVLLGDSFTNIYSAVGDLHWGGGAGLGEHLARELGLPVDVIAINGEAATGVRERLASRPNSEAMMRQKKTVVWAIAARDLFLSETTARANDVKWADVEFNAEGEVLRDSSGASEPVVVEAEMSLKSVIPDPQQVTYNDALYGAEYLVKKVIAPSLNPDAPVSEGDVLNVVHWGFRGKAMTPESAYQIGDTRTLRLVPFSEKSELQQTQLANDAGFALTVWFDEPQTATEESPGNDGSVVTASVACVLVSLLVAAGILGVARRLDRSRS